MPYTISHIAAVVPAYRPLSRARVFTAAVIGSMVPDFGMMLGDYARWQTHSLPALLTFCLPVGLISYLLTMWLIRPAAIEALPDGAYARLSAAGAPPLSSLRHWVLVLLALLGGAITHLIWDGFTHETSRGVRLFPQLLDYGPEMGGHALRLYRWAQYGSSVFGLIVVFIAVGVWLAHARSPTPRPVRRLAAAERGFWLLLYVLLPLAWLTRVSWRLWHFWHGHWHVDVPAGFALTVLGVASLRAAAGSLLFVSVLLRLRLRAAPVVLARSLDDAAPLR